MKDGIGPGRPAEPATTLVPAPERGPDAGTMYIDFEKYRLENGLELILHVDRRLPIVHVNQWYHVGSKNERRGRTGFAHLFEHLMFEGSKNADGEYFKYVEKIGANLREGGANGTTSHDRTNYFVTAPSGSLEFLIWLESDRLTGLVDAMTQEKLDNQRDVVKNERRQTVENRPYGRAFTVLFESLFTAGHPYSWSVIGSHEDLTAATLDDVVEFFRTFYTPNNLTLTLAGDFDPGRARDLVDQYYGPVAPGPALSRPRLMPATLQADRRVVVADRVAQPRTYLAWPATAYFESLEADLDLAALVLAQGLSSRLQRSLVYEEQICSNVSASMYGLEIAGVFLVMATARPGVDLERVEGRIVEELERLGRDGPTALELARARNSFELDFVSGLERIGGFGGKADRLAQYNTFLGNPDLIGRDLTRYRAATQDSVRDAVASVLVGRPKLAVRFVPEEAARSPAPEPDRTVPPELEPDRPFQIPDVTELTTRTGLKVFVVTRREIPKVAVRLVARQGSADASAEHLGLANLTMRVVDKGTPRRSALEIQEAFASLGTSLQRMAGREACALAMEVLTKDLDAGMELFAEVVQGASFPEAEVDRERTKCLDDLLQLRKDANRLAGRLVPMLVYGRRHPYGQPETGDESTLARLRSTYLNRFHVEAFTPAHSALILTGDIDPDRALELAERFLGDLPQGGGGAKHGLVPAPPARPPGRIYLVDRPEAPQSVLVQLLPGATVGHRDHDALKLADAVYGGSFHSRLNMNLREEKGYTYGVFSGLNCLKSHAFWQAAGSIQTQHTADALREFMKELDDIGRNRPVTEPELEEARNNRVRGYSQAFETMNRLASHVAGLWALERPMSDLLEECARLEAATLDDVERVCRQYADPARASYLIVGDLGRVRGPLEALGAGERIVLTDPENPE